MGSEYGARTRATIAAALVVVALSAPALAGMGASLGRLPTPIAITPLALLSGNPPPHRQLPSTAETPLSPLRLRIEAYPLPSDPPSIFVNDTSILFNGTVEPGDYLAANGQGPLGLAYDPAQSEVFVADWYASYVSVISTTTLSVTATISAGLDPYGIVYDASKGEVYVANSDSDNVSVINATTNAVVASVPVGSMPLGVAFDNLTGEIFTANAGSDNVSVISDSNNSVIASIQMPVNPFIGDYPAAVVYDSNQKEVFVANYDDYSVSIIDATNDSLNTTVDTAGAPYFLAYDPAQGEVLASNYYSNDVTVISDRNDSVVTTIGVRNPEGVAYDGATGDILVANSYSDTVYIINAANNTVVTENAVGGRSPESILAIPALSESFVTCLASGTVSVLSRSYNVTNTLPVATLPVDLAYDSGKGELFVVDYAANDVLVLSDRTGRVLATVPVGFQSWLTFNGVAYDSETGQVFVVNTDSNNVSVISDSTDTVVATIAVPTGPDVITYDGANDRIYVGSESSVSVISCSNDTLMATISVPGYPDALTYDSGTDQIFVGTEFTSNISVISASNDTIVAKIPHQYDVSLLAFDSRTDNVFADAEGNLSEIADSNDSVVHVLWVNALWGLTVDSVNGDVFAPEGDAANAVAVLSGTNDSLIATVPVGAWPAGATFDFGDGLVYVVNINQGTLSGIYSGPEVDYGVSFHEVGLPPGANWTVALVGINRSSTGGAVDFSEPNGTYSFEVGSLTGYSPSPAIGDVDVQGGAVTLNITFRLVYPVSFEERGLPSGTDWSVTLNGNRQGSSTTMITFAEPNGTYPYSIADVAGWHQTNLSYTGSVTVNGTAVRESILVFTDVTYTVTFAESGLPSDSNWTVSVAGVAGNLTTDGGTDILTWTGLANGTYPYAISPISGWWQTTISSSGTETVTGTALAVTVVYSRVVYSVTFSEAGLPPGVEWYVNVTGELSLSNVTSVSGGTTVTTALPNGTFSFTVASNDKRWAPAYASGFAVSGGPETVPIEFVLVSYSVVFEESGLPSGLTWLATVNGVWGYLTTDGGTDTLMWTGLANGTYAYSIVDLSGWHQAILPYSGSVVVSGASVTESTLVYTPVTYTVTFRESGLPEAATWYVNITGEPGLSESVSGSSSTSVSINLPNGTYAYGAATNNENWIWTTSDGGSFTVLASPLSVAVPFMLTSTSEPGYQVTFTEHGLPNGSVWWVNITSQAWSSTAVSGPRGTQLFFWMLNGSYSYTVATNWKNWTTTGGNFSVSGSAENLPVSFTAVGTSSAAPWTALPWLWVGAGMGVAILLAVMMLFFFLENRRRRKKDERQPPPSTTEPSESSLEKGP